MTLKEKVLLDAQQAPKMDKLRDHREAIEMLREKGYTYRGISEFLRERGIKAEYTQVFRLLNKRKRK